MEYEKESAKKQYEEDLMKWNSIIAPNKDSVLLLIFIIFTRPQKKISALARPFFFNSVFHVQIIRMKYKLSACKILLKYN